MDAIGYMFDVGFRGLGLGRYLVAGIAPATAALVVVLLAKRYGRAAGSGLTLRRAGILLCAGLSPMLFLGAAHALVAEKDVTLAAVVRIAAVNSQYAEVCDTATGRVSTADVRSASDFLRASDVLWPNAGNSEWAALTATEAIPCGSRPNVDLGGNIRLRNAYGTVSRGLSVLGYGAFWLLMVGLFVEWGGATRRRAAQTKGPVGAA
ncbi:hypothetical protein QF002_001120 [Paraburkholderia youngii]